MNKSLFASLIKINNSKKNIVLRIHILKCFFHLEVNAICGNNTFSVITVIDMLLPIFILLMDIHYKNNVITLISVLNNVTV